MRWPFVLNRALLFFAIKLKKLGASLERQVAPHRSGERPSGNSSSDSGSEAPTAGSSDRPLGTPPAHWVERVRHAAPELLRPARGRGHVAPPATPIPLRHTTELPAFQGQSDGSSETLPGPTTRDAGRAAAQARQRKDVPPQRPAQPFKMSQAKPGNLTEQSADRRAEALHSGGSVPNEKPEPAAVQLPPPSTAWSSDGFPLTPSAPGRHQIRPSCSAEQRVSPARRPSSEERNITSVERLSTEAPLLHAGPSPTRHVARTPTQWDSSDPYQHPT